MVPIVSESFIQASDTSLQMGEDTGTEMGGKLTLKVLVITIDAQWEGMGDVGSAR